VGVQTSAVHGTISFLLSGSGGSCRNSGLGAGLKTLGSVLQEISILVRNICANRSGSVIVFEVVMNFGLAIRR